MSLCTRILGQTRRASSLFPWLVQTLPRPLKVTRCMKEMSPSDAVNIYLPKAPFNTYRGPCFSASIHYFINLQTILKRVSKAES